LRRFCGPADPILELGFSTLDSRFRPSGFRTTSATTATAAHEDTSPLDEQAVRDAFTTIPIAGHDTT